MEKRLLAWAGIGLVLISWMAAAIWFLARLDARVASLEQDMDRLIWSAGRQEGPPGPRR